MAKKLSKQGLSPEDVKVCARFKLILDEKGLNQSEAAKKIGITQNTISRFIHCKNAPSLTHIRKILLAFDVNPAWFILGANEPMFNKDKNNKSAMVDKKSLKSIATGLANLSEKLNQIVK